MKPLHKNMDQQQKNMETLKSLKIEAENMYSAIKLKMNQLPEGADQLTYELNLADIDLDSRV